MSGERWEKTKYWYYAALFVAYLAGVVVGTIVFRWLWC
jgi:hypothetical protein